MNAVNVLVGLLRCLPGARSVAMLCHAVAFEAQHVVCCALIVVLCLHCAVLCCALGRLLPSLDVMLALQHDPDLVTSVMCNRNLSIW